MFIELRSVLTTLEIHHSPADLLQVFKKIDVDGSGAIDWNEFVELMVNK
jgi:Ca2+-binding EF-hand superfamily protein